MLVFLAFTVPRAQSSLTDSLRASLKSKVAIAAHGIRRFFEERIAEASALSQADVLEGSDVTAQIQYLNEVKEASPWIDDLDIIGNDGIVICSSEAHIETGWVAQDALPGIGTTLRAAVQGAQGEVFLSDAISIDSGTGLCFITPITDDDNRQVLSVLCIEVSLEAIAPLLGVFLEILSDQGARSALLIDDKGRVVVDAAGRTPTFETFPDLAAAPELLHQAAPGNLTRSAVYTNVLGEKVVAACMGLGEFGENRALNWSIVTSVSLADWSSSFVRTATQFVMLGLVLALAAVAIGVLFSRSVVKRIGSICKAATSVAGGNLDASAPEGGKDELSVLGGTFNHMVTRLRELSVRQEDAKRTADAANRSKSEFLANMSHEIRTPMTAILGYAETLLDRGLSEAERLNCVQTIRRNGDSLLTIINDILDLSKIEAGKIDTRQIQCDPNSIVTDVCSLIRVQAEAKGISLDVEYQSPMPEVIHTDPVRLRQILVNLIGNAIKFTDRGSVRIVLRLLHGVDCGTLLAFDVRDTGRGMPVEAVESLFEPFSQGDSSATRKNGGSGLGLAISKRFAELLGGDVTVLETREGVGTTFRATVATGSLANVRMVRDPGPGAGIQGSPVSPVSSDRSALEGLRILLAEDGPDNQRLISFLLRGSGAEVTVVENGKLACDLALGNETEPFDCILMDMQMPVMDGYEATGTLRRRGYQRPILALTAHAMSGDKEKCIGAGCDDYATKPIRRAALVEMITQHCRPKVSRRP